MVKVKEDLTGKVFGRLTVTKRDPDKIKKDGHGKAMWFCDCECGKKNIIKEGYFLRNGKATSCGCIKNEKRIQAINNKWNTKMIGKRFGRLIVIKEGNPIKSKSRSFKTWECQCDCGNTCEVTTHRLIHGITQSCGCYRSELCGIMSKKYNKKHCEYDLETHEYGVGKATNNGKEFYFDKEDYDLIKEYAWLSSPLGYLRTSYRDENDKLQRIQLHRLIMGVDDPKIVIDHINHNVYDNRKVNLRITNLLGNQKNLALAKNNTSGHTGIYFEKDRGTWRANIFYNGKGIYLGSYKNKEDAIAARKAAEEKYFGEYSYDNSMKIAEENKIVNK